MHKKPVSNEKQLKHITIMHQILLLFL